MTPGRLASADSAAAGQLIDRIREAGEAGVDFIQVRERGLEAGALLRFVRRAVTAAGASRVLVNERADVALAAGAAGVHLRGDSLAASRLRPFVPEGFVVGQSVHSRQEAEDTAKLGGIDFLMFGTVFPSASKPAGHEAAGIAALQQVTAAVPVPVIAIGGMTAARAAEAIAAGAAGVAAIGLFDGSQPLAPLVTRLRAVV